VNWDWVPETTFKAGTGMANATASSSYTAFDILVEAVKQPDDGMDQNLNITPDQKYMGGFEGPSSQAIRHMYYRPFSMMAPLTTFHYPLREMGEAPERAEIYFQLAGYAKAGGHPYWAWRFLAWGLHYVQDLTQPFHASQFGSFRLLPLGVLLTLGWEPFVKETTRIVGNYHIALEQYAGDVLDLNRDNSLLYAFKVPKGDEGMKVALEQNMELTIREGVKRVAEASSELAPRMTNAERGFMGDQLVTQGLDLVAGFKTPDGKPKLDFRAIEARPEAPVPQKQLLEAIVEAFSNAGVATRWYVDRFQKL
jgi:hypothetical protein